MLKQGSGCFLRDKRLFELTEVEITRVDCSIPTEMFSCKDQANTKLVKAILLLWFLYVTCCYVHVYIVFWQYGHNGPVVQNIVSLTSSLRGQLDKCFTTL